MAIIKCGYSGDAQEGSVYVGKINEDHTDERKGAKSLVLYCNPNKGDHGFPVMLTLDRNELLELVAEICSKMLPGAEVDNTLTPPASNFVFVGSKE